MLADFSVISDASCLNVYQTSFEAMTRPGRTPSETTIVFGPFKLLPQRKELLEDDRPMRLGARALDILTLLVERKGEVVSKEEIFAYVWPNTHVEETNLRVNMSALRKALRDDGALYIKNMPGRGYCFVAPVTEMEDRQTASASSQVPAIQLRGFPITSARMIGREDALASIKEQLLKHRFVTIVGPGGIGKTTVAVATVKNLSNAFRHGALFIDLAPLTDASLVASALASALGLPIASENPLPGLIAFLRDKSILILLDNCEHVIGPAALLSEALLNGAPDVRILATSREAMRAEGERVHRLPTMEVPAEIQGISASEAAAFPSVQLFVERAMASSDTFQLTDKNAPVIAELCRRLDGLPLAIEIAAARVNSIGVQLLTAQINERLFLLSEGRRTALPRHQTLHATLDWSYGLLSEHEQAILRAICVYRAAFCIESAQAVAAAVGLNDGMVMEGLAGLSEKSLLKIDATDHILECRLLDSTRAYAYGKLRDSGDLQTVLSRHAERLLEFLTKAERDWDELSTPIWLRQYSPLIDDVRAALTWAHSNEGNLDLAEALTAAAVPLWMHLSLTKECCDSISKVLARLESSETLSSERAHRQMKLLAALGVSLLYTRGPGPRIDEALNAARAIAEKLSNIEYQLRAVWGTFTAALIEANYPAALERATLFKEIAKNSANANDLQAGNRIIGLALHLLGRQIEARSYIEGMLRSYVVTTRRSDYVRFQYEQRVAAWVPVAAILWLQGLPDKAMQNAKRAVEEAQGIGHALSLGYALSTAGCPIAFLVGDLITAEKYIAMLSDHSAAYDLGPWAAWGRFFKGMLSARQGDLHDGISQIAAALEEMRSIGFVLRYTAYLAEYAELLGQAGRIDEGLTVIEEALKRCEVGQEIWCLAEVMRIKANLLKLKGTPGAFSEAESLLQASLDNARKYETLGWELRTATSLARLLIEQHRPSEARTILQDVYSKMTEGFDSADVVKARCLLEALERS